jgi:hypothetical protein
MPASRPLLEIAAGSVEAALIAMVRPRPAGFCYRDAEFRVRRRDIDLILERRRRTDSMNPVPTRCGRCGRCWAEKQKQPKRR